jgi:hypothetical protein
MQGYMRGHGTALLIVINQAMIAKNGIETYLQEYIDAREMGLLELLIDILSNDCHHFLTDSKRD